MILFVLIPYIDSVLRNKSYGEWVYIIIYCLYLDNNITTYDYPTISPDIIAQSNIAYEPVLTTQHNVSYATSVNRNDDIMYEVLPGEQQQQENDDYENLASN